MIRKLFLALMLMVSPALAQEVPLTDPTQIPTVEQTYTFTQQQTVTPIQDVRDEGGTALTLYDDGVSQAISLGFDFYFYGNLYNSVYISQNGFISFTSQANGCCSGNVLPYFTEWTEQNASSFQYISLNNSIFAMWSDLADFNDPGNPYYKSTGSSFVVGWYSIDELGSQPTTCDQTGCFSTGPGNKFTFEISLFSDSSFSINYGAFDYNNSTGRTFTSGYQGDQTGEFYQIYNGNDPSSLQNTTYLVSSSEIVPPPPPPPPPPPEEPIAPDCTVNPYDPTCIINSTIDGVTDEPMLAEETSVDSTDEEEAAVEELVAIVEEIFDSPAEEMQESLEELLAEEISDDEEEEVATKEIVAASSPIKEMVNEEKAATLSDSISKDVLESALAVASAAETTAATTVSSSDSSSSSSSRSSSVAGGSSESTVASSDSSSSSTSFDSSNQESTAAGDASMELLETGRVIGQEALASTMAATEASANDSISQAEGVAQTSSFESMSASSTVETINSIEIESVIETVTTESNTDTNTEMMAASENGNETVVSDGSEIFTSMENNPAAASAQEAEDVALAVVNNSIASSEQKTFEDETNTDAEITNAMVDPALAMANTFNQPPSMMNLEILGIVKPIEEKSDAELRAEQVVAANKEEQDAINANYMDADQSGILAAIGADADVSSYLSTRLADNNTWYKPEDIYKGVKINDNVRGSYFLEKGNTDTYKKMVEEQYK